MFGPFSRTTIPPPLSTRAERGVTNKDLRIPGNRGTRGGWFITLMGAGVGWVALVRVVAPVRVVALVRVGAPVRVVALVRVVAPVRVVALVRVDARALVRVNAVRLAARNYLRVGAMVGVAAALLLVALDRADASLLWEWEWPKH